MTRIGGKSVHTELDQGVITFNLAGTEWFRINPTGGLKDTFGGTLKGLVGGAFSVTSASALSAVGTSTSGLSAFQMPHGLSTTPTIFDATPATSAGALVSLLGTYVTADATNVYLNSVAAFTAAKPYTFQWFAAP